MSNEKQQELVDKVAKQAQKKHDFAMKTKGIVEMWRERNPDKSLPIYKDKNGDHIWANRKMRRKMMREAAIEKRKKAVAKKVSGGGVE